MPFVAGAVTGIAWTVYVATINPTVGAAIVAAVTTIAQTALMLWHDRRATRKLDERRLVAVRTEDAVVIADEERRELADDRARPSSAGRVKPESRKMRGGRRRERRNGPL